MSLGGRCGAEIKSDGHGGVRMGGFGEEKALDGVAGAGHHFADMAEDGEHAAFRVERVGAAEAVLVRQRHGWRGRGAERRGAETRLWNGWDGDVGDVVCAGSANSGAQCAPAQCAS